MKLQELTESLKVGLDEQSTLSLKLTDTIKFFEELRKEIEVNDNSSYTYVHINFTHVVMCVPIHSYVCTRYYKKLKFGK